MFGNAKKDSLSRALVLPILMSVVVFVVGCASTAGTGTGQPKDGAVNTNTEKKADKSTSAAEKKPAEEPAPSTEDPVPSDAGQEVSIEAYKFSPETLTIKAGTKVTWINHDAADHQAHEDTEAWKSPIFGKEKVFEQVFTAPGKYQYHCHVHPNMRGTIIVE